MRKSISPPLLITKTPTGREWCLRRGAGLVGIKSPTLPTVTLDSTTVAHRVRRWDGVLFIHILCSGYTLNRFHVADGFEWFIQWHQQGVLRGIRNHLSATLGIIWVQLSSLRYSTRTILCTWMDALSLRLADWNTLTYCQTLPRGAPVGIGN